MNYEKIGAVILVAAGFLILFIDKMVSEDSINSNPTLQTIVDNKLPVAVASFCAGLILLYRKKLFSKADSSDSSPSSGSSKNKTLTGTVKSSVSDSSPSSLTPVSAQTPSTESPIFSKSYD